MLLGNALPIIYYKNPTGAGSDADAFIFKIRLSAPYGDGANGGRLTVPGGFFAISTDPSYTYDFDVNWGDGSFSNGNTAEVTHQYPDLGEYEIKITGTYPKPYFNPAFSTQLCIYDIVQWGTQKWSSFNRSFFNTIGLGNPDPNFFPTPISPTFQLSCVDTPDLSEIEADGLVEMFRDSGVYKINNLNNWEIPSNVTSFNSMFRDAEFFTEDMDDWDVSYVSDFHDMFYYCRRLNPTTGYSNWETGKNVTGALDLSGMFRNCEAIVAADMWEQDSFISGVTSVDCERMFSACDAWKLQLTNWDNTSSLINNVEYMFERVGSDYSGSNSVPYTTDGLKTDFFGWDFNSNKTSLEGMFQSAYLDSTFDCNLNGHTATNITNFNRLFGGGCFVGGATTIDNWTLSTTPGISMQYTFSGRGYSSQGRDAIDWTGTYGPVQTLLGWDVSGVTDFTGCFSGSQFGTGPDDVKPILGTWTLCTDVNSSVNLTSMFNNSLFNDTLVNDAAKWNTIRVTSMLQTFGGSGGTRFNQSLSNWDTSNVTDMRQFVYYNAYFNQDISHFDMGKVTTINRMFDKTQAYSYGFDWMEIPLLTGNNERFQYQWKLDTQKYTDMLNAWGAYYYGLTTPPTNVTLGMNTIGYWGLTQYFTAGLNTLANGMTTREYMVTPTGSGGLGWTITDGGGI